MIWEHYGYKMHIDGRLLELGARYTKDHIFISSDLLDMVDLSELCHGW